MEVRNTRGGFCSDFVCLYPYDRYLDCNQVYLDRFIRSNFLPNERVIEELGRMACARHSDDLSFLLWYGSLWNLHDFSWAHWPDLISCNNSMYADHVCVQHSLFMDGIGSPWKPSMGDIALHEKTRNVVPTSCIFVVRPPLCTKKSITLTNTILSCQIVQSLLRKKITKCYNL